MGNCMVTRRKILLQKKKGKPATTAVRDGQTLRSTSSSNQAMSSKLETTARSRDHIIFGNNLEIHEKRTSNDNRDVKSTGAARVMRIRVVVTQSQLSQIMKESKNSASLSSSSAAVKQMLLTSTIKVSSTENSVRSTQNDQGGRMNGKWRPRLKSILEE